AVDHLERQVVALRDLSADGGVRAFDLVVDGLADVVKEAAHLGGRDVFADLCRDDRGEVTRLDDVVEHVLAIARPVLQPTEELDDLCRQPPDTGLGPPLLAGLPDDEIDFGPRLRDDFLDTTWM